MPKKPIAVEKWEYHPLTPDRWEDFERLFGPNGACAGCWCAWWLMTNKEFTTSRKEGHKELLRTRVQSGIEPGIIAYADGVPAGWVALAPRTEYKRLATSKLLAAVDDQPVWVISCFYIYRDYRHQGLMAKLITAAEEYAREKGVKILEAFPIEAKERISPLSIYTGIAAEFYKQGFEQAVKRESRLILRKAL
jgi:GNAT superfamily N-acetyltransferase